MICYGHVPAHMRKAMLIITQAIPTVIFNYTVTPTVTSTTTPWFTSSVTVSNSKTMTMPSATVYTTTQPPPTTVTSGTTLTRTFKTWTHTAFYTTVTMTASCTVPPRPQQPDPTWQRKPQIVHSLPSGLRDPGSNRWGGWNNKREKAYAIRDQLRKERRSGMLADEIKAAEIDRGNLVKRSVDVATVTITGTSTTATSTVSIDPCLFFFLFFFTVLA